METNTFDAMVFCNKTFFYTRGFDFMKRLYELEKRLGDLEKKYSDLVWIARKSKEDEEDNRKVRVRCKRIREAYPEEVEKLKEPPSDWAHGFDSGMLAAVRLIEAHLEGDKKYIKIAEETFPDLDT